jgi:hypothetical protein
MPFTKRKHHAICFPMNKETLKFIIQNFHEKGIPFLYERKLKLPLKTKKVIAVVGIRRSGKTYLLFQTIKELMANKVPMDRIIYINFEDDRLFPVKLQGMDHILNAYYELYPENITAPKYIFLDEIQHINNWEKYVRRIFDTENITIYITGSSSALITQKISTALRGRVIHYEVFPLSFQEILQIKNIQIKPYLTSSEAKMSHALTDYISWGGFPEVVIETDNNIRSKILKEYADLMFYKDLVEQFSLKNQYLLKYLLKHMITNPAALCSINKLFQTLKSQGLSLSKNSLYEYLEYLQQVNILFVTEKYSKSLRVKQQNPSKYYIIDTGLMQIFGIEKHQNIGSKLENIIYLHLRTCENVKEIFYYQNKYETDFLYHTDNKSYFINVSDTVHSIETATRETRSLMNAQKQYPETKSFLVLNEWTNELIPDNISVIPALRFLTANPAQF